MNTLEILFINFETLEKFKPRKKWLLPINILKKMSIQPLFSRASLIFCENIRLFKLIKE